MAENKTKKQDRDAFESTAQAQWNKNRERFEFLQNGIIELGKFFGLTVNPVDGTLVAYHPENARLQLPAPSSSHKPQTGSEQESSAIDLDLLSQAIIKGLCDEIKTFLKENPIKASIDDSIHIANNKTLIDTLDKMWIRESSQMCVKANIIQDIKEDSSVVYRINKQGLKKRLVDKEEKARLDLLKKPKIVRMFYTQVNNIKKVSIFFIMAVVIIIMSIWNICLQYENHDLELTKKEYMILRWHVNTKPKSKAFMEELDSFVKAEGISPVYDRVVEDIKTSKEHQKHNTNKN